MMGGGHEAGEPRSARTDGSADGLNGRDVEHGHSDVGEEQVRSGRGDACIGALIVELVAERDNARRGGGGVGGGATEGEARNTALAHLA